jgi:hypothetical protein
MMKDARPPSLASGPQVPMEGRHMWGNLMDNGVKQVVTSSRSV